MSKISNFNASSVLLDGSNLVEASAGTGKTYSIAILVLRLLIEKKLSVKEILMVTFTNAAVAELEHRIRSFIRKAYKASLGENINDDTIALLVHNSIEEKGISEVQEILKEAVLFLDETNVLTIHGFCQQTLTEFAFEADQVFGMEILQDISGVLEEKVNQFWRQYVTTIPSELLSFLLEQKLSRDGITQIIKDHLSGKKYFDYKADEDYMIREEDHLVSIKELNEANEKISELSECLVKHIVESKEILKEECEKNAYTKKNLLHLIDTPKEFLKFIIAKKDLQNVKKVFGTIIEKCDECETIENEIEAIIQRVITDLNCLALHTIIPGIESMMKANNQVSFDELIINLYKALITKDNPSLVEALRKKYKAVFIDEFQDTDRLQYEIFKKAFGENTILFYIGDPKQSIYAFRKADIFTYFKAYDDVHHRYEMNENYRSSKSLIDAMNYFFVPTANFDTFYFNNEQNQIKYIPVESPGKNTKGDFIKDKKSVVPISISDHKKNDDICEAVAAQVRDLLESDYAISKDGIERKLTPSDMGILVKTNKQGKEIKHALSKYAIPAVIISDDKLFESEEARYVLYLLVAMGEPNQNNINKALLSPFTGFTVADLLKIDNESALNCFNNYNIRWEQEGIYPAIMDFINEFNVKNILLNNHTENGQRRITNLFQLTELLHKTQSDKKFSVLELINWFSRGIQGMKLDGDEYVQRMESDEEAVKIVTIHKSKGLEYNIVLAPFLDFKIDRKKHAFINYRDPETGEYITIEKTKINEKQLEIADQQAEQEFRRLLYVSITRAVYQCIIFKNTHYKTSTITTFTSELNSGIPDLIEIKTIPEIPEGYKYKQQPKSKTTLKKEPVNFNLLQKNWKKLSYTMLAKKNEHSLKDRTASSLGKYDRFIFHELKGGIKTGLMLHDIFERIHFTDNKKWKAVLEEVSKKYIPKQKEEWFSFLEEMLNQVLNAPITIDDEKFKLNEVEFEKRIHEFEFDFPVPVFDPQLLNKLSDENIQVQVNFGEDLEGIMNGKIDLFFECKEKYFVLDWKSNFLGASLDVYSKEKLNDAMSENNYHLQYLIYTLAAKKYLESRLPGFDYERDFGGVIYVFLRGVRTNADSGIFVSKPSIKIIEKLEEILCENVYAEVGS
jgi:exodeoxyribonuclease V beta subunit